MVTTIQISDTTLKLLKKLKAERHAKSYDEVIITLSVQNTEKESLGGFLGKKPHSEIMKGLREKHDRF